MSKTVLMLHNNAPAQFVNWISFFELKGWKVLFASPFADKTRLSKRVKHLKPQDFSKQLIQNNQQNSTLEAHIRNGDIYLDVFERLRASGVYPSIIVSHSGWGCGLHAKTIFPDAMLISYAEWYFSHPSPFTRFISSDPLIEASDSFICALLKRNMSSLSELCDADLIVSPTEWQANQLPDFLRNKTQIIFDGLTPFFCKFALQACHPSENQRGKHGELLPSLAKWPIMATYFTRGFEPIRLFPLAAKVIKHSLDQDPDLCYALAGSRKIHYGGGKSASRHIDSLFDDYLIDYIKCGRIKVLPRLAYKQYLLLLSRSCAHLYTTGPFVASWSLFEALGLNVPTIANSSEPVLDITRNLPSSNPSLAGAGDLRKFSALIANYSKKDIPKPFTLSEHKEFLVKHSWVETHRLLEDALT